jgi:hypothetical protein
MSYNHEGSVEGINRKFFPEFVSAEKAQAAGRQQEQEYYTALRVYNF